MMENLFGCSLFDDDSVVHEDDMVGDLFGETHLMGHHNHGHFIFRQISYYLEDLARQFRIERRSRLIKA